MAPPIPTPIRRLIHVDSLRTLLLRGAVHAPNYCSADGLYYRPIHDPEVQIKRQDLPVPCGPRGAIKDYVSFYFGARSPMLYRHWKHTVPGSPGGQDVLIYLCSTAQAAGDAGLRFVFTDGHSLAHYTSWFDQLSDLERVDWAMVQERQWADTLEDGDRCRRKQAEFLVHQVFPWSLVHELVVIDASRAAQVRNILAAVPAAHQPLVVARKGWYY